VVDVEFDSRKLESRFKVDFLDFRMSLCTEDHSAIELVVVEREVVRIPRFASDLL